MRIVSPRDYGLMLHLNQELVNRWVDTEVIIFKVHQQLSKTNSYGESTKKAWHPGVVVPCLVDRDGTQAAEQLQTVDVTQTSTFAFLRYELEQRKVYPEQGDIIQFDNQYYEINNTNETQLWAGRVEYKHSIVCETHLTRLTALQIEQPIR